MRKKVVLWFCFLCFFGVNLSASLPGAEEAKKEEMINHLIGIQNIFDGVYAPAKWKKESFGWDIKTSTQQAMEKIASQPDITLKEYHEILAGIFNDIKDFHVSIYFYSTEQATLPFRVRGAEGRYFVVWTDPELASDFPLKEGDEVLSFDGQPIEEVVRSLVAGDRRDLINQTDLELASIFLTMRSGTLGHRVPQGNVDVKVRSNKEIHPCTYTLDWNYSKELIKSLPGSSMVKEKKKKINSPKNRNEAIRQFNTYANMSFATAAVLKQALRTKADGAFPMSARDGPLPFLGTPLWKSKEDALFRSYIFKNDQGKSIGYIRIPHFLGINRKEEAEEGADEGIDELRVLVRSFQRKTDALVIDTTDNSGGYLHVLLSYLGVFSSQPMPNLKQQVSITQEDVLESIFIASELDEILQLPIDEQNRVELEQVRDYFAFIYNEWSEGRFLSDPVFLYGVDKVVPDPVVSYKKPILVLTNELDFSCADIFPAILQDCGRATIFGAKTAGAGGAIRAHDYPNRLGIHQYTYTFTLLQRANLQPLENLGVSPNIPYNVTPDDIQNGYEGYKKAVHKALKTLL